MGNRLTKVAVAGASALALCGLGTGVAMAAPPTAAPAAASAPAGHAKHPGEHGEFTGQGKAHRTIDFQRGTVTSVSSTSMTVRSADGFSATYTFGPKIKVEKQKQPGSTSSIQTNDRIFVAAVKETDGLRAVRVRDHGNTPAEHSGTPAPAPSAGTPITPQ